MQQSHDNTQDLKGEGGKKDLLAKCLLSLLGELRPVDLVHLTLVTSTDDMQDDAAKKPEIKEVIQCITGIQVIYRACSVYSQGMDVRGN